MKQVGFKAGETKSVTFFGKVVIVSVPWTGTVTYSDGTTRSDVEGTVESKIFASGSFDI